jgi:hypothetical protein
VDPGVAVDPLYVPDTSELDLPADYADAFSLALSLRTASPWAAHVATLGMATPGCPDLWVGAPDDASIGVGTDAPGMSWSDHCANGGGVDFAGGVYWESGALSTGDAASAEGAVTGGARRLVGDALVGAGADARFEFDGEASDAVTRSVAPGYDHWTWSSLVQATVSGSDVPAAALSLAGGYRTDMYLYAEGGDAGRVEARGDVYLFDDRIAAHFDSVSLDLALIAPTGAGPSDCTAEPYGWIGLRDTDAYWYDVVFLPRDEEDATDAADLAACDGCGTLYVRGVESGEVCVDLSAAWDGRLAPPPIEDFVLPLHDLP